MTTVVCDICNKRIYGYEGRHFKIKEYDSIFCGWVHIDVHQNCLKTLLAVKDTSEDTK